MAIENQHRSVIKLLVARESNRFLFTTIGARQQPSPIEIGRWNADKFDPPMMLEVKDRIMQRRIHAAAQHTFNTKHGYFLSFLSA
jgi:hypothetical protein